MKEVQTATLEEFASAFDSLFGGNAVAAAICSRITEKPAGDKTPRRSTQGGEHEVQGK